MYDQNEHGNLINTFVKAEKYLKGIELFYKYFKINYLNRFLSGRAEYAALNETTLFVCKVSDSNFMIQIVEELFC